MRTRCLSLFAFLAFLFLILPAEGADPSGAKTYSDTIEGLKCSINFDWSLISAFLMFFMMTGFIFLGGFLRPKNMLNYMGHCIFNSFAGALIFWLFGFALLLGGSELASGLDGGNSLFGYSGFLLLGDAHDVNTSLLWIFQVAPCILAATIIAGPVAERIKLKSYAVCILIFCGIAYPIYGHWIWGEGWLFTLPLGVGVRDFAGSGVVHAVGGITGLIGAWALGPRIGKYNADKSANTIHGHNMFYVVIGTFVLWFGWLGYNVGGTLAGTDLRISVIATNTFLAAVGGAAMVSLIYVFSGKKVDVLMVCNGILAGLVAISASCAYVPAWASILIGVLGGFFMWGTTLVVEHVFKVDDPLGAVGVHAANGIWGLLTVGIFADGTYGNVYGIITGHGGQFLAQLIAAITAIGWAFVTGYATFFGVKHVMGLRVNDQEELTGLDLYNHGMECYPKEEKYLEDVEDVIRKHIFLGELIEEKS